MNKRISVLLAGIALMAAALAGCGSLHVSPGASGSLHAAATSSAVKSEAAEAGKAVLSTCIPAKDITKTYLISLAEKPSAAKVLAKKCDIPKGRRVAFAKAVGISALNAYMHGDFKTAKGQQTWADQAFPVILKTYQSK